MALFLSQSEIDDLLSEEKPLPRGYERRLVRKPKRGHREVDMDITGARGSRFRVIVRESQINRFDFSVVLAYLVPNTNQVLRLRRYNGKSHEHTNPLENETFYDFHVHEITERYQQGGRREDTYAKPTSRYGSAEEALGCLIDDCSFQRPSDTQGALFSDMME